MYSNKFTKKRWPKTQFWRFLGLKYNAFRVSHGTSSLLKFSLHFMAGAKFQCFKLCWVDQKRGLGWCHLIQINFGENIIFAFLLGGSPSGIKCHNKGKHWHHKYYLLFMNRFQDSLFQQKVFSNTPRDNFLTNIETYYWWCWQKDFAWRVETIVTYSRLAPLFSSSGEGDYNQCERRRRWVWTLLYEHSHSPYLIFVTSPRARLV